MKVVINRNTDFFMLSEQAVLWLKEKGLSDEEINELGRCQNETRTNKLLVEVVETLGKDASGGYSKLKVVEIPFNTMEGWYIESEDYMETVVEEHRYWN